MHLYNLNSKFEQIQAFKIKKSEKYMNIYKIRYSSEYPCWLVGFYGISFFVGYLMPNPFLYKYSVLFQAIQFSQTVLIQTIKKVLFQVIQFSISMSFKCQNSSISNNSV